VRLANEAAIISLNSDNISVFVTDMHSTHLRLLLLGTQVDSGVRGGAVVEALRYKPERRGIDSRWCHWIFSLT
jgi:hypothetical protein